MADEYYSKIGDVEMNLGNALEIHVDGKKMDRVYAFRLCARGSCQIGRYVEIERYMSRDVNKPFPAEMGDDLPTERFLFTADRVELVDTGVKFNAEPD